MSVTVRERLASDGSIGLLAHREAAEKRAGGSLGTSVRDLLDAYHVSVLRIELMRFTVGEGAQMRELLAFLQDVSDGGSREFGRAIWRLIRGESGAEPMPVRIDVWVDGEFDRCWDLEVLDNRTHRLEGDTSPIRFHDSVVLRLYETSMDLILQESDGPTPGGGRRMAVEIGRIEEPGRVVHSIEGLVGTYELDCHLDVEVGLLPSANSLIDHFESRSGGGAWANLDRARVAQELRDTIAAPQLIRQGPTPLCGPASVLYSLAKRAPRRYVQAATQLFDHGRFQMKTEAITADADLRRAQVPAEALSTTRQVDWLLASSMRNSANRVFRIEGAAPWLAGITTASEVALWARELLGYEDLTTQEATVTAPTGFDFGGFFGALSLGIAVVNRVTGRSADEVFREAVITTRDGGEAYLMTTIKMFDGAVLRDDPRNRVRDGDAEDINTFWQGAPIAARHWVTIREQGPGHPLNVTHDGRYQFDAFTWGAYYGVDAARTHFERQTFMVVCARVGHQP